jgi:hypothetical protein
VFVEMLTDTRGAAWSLLYLAGLNVLDMRRDPSLLAWVRARMSHPRGFVYRRETPDVWTSEAVDRWRDVEHAAGRSGRRAHLPDSRMGAHSLAGARFDLSRPIGQDCEDLAAGVAAERFLAGCRVRVCVTQPHGHGVSHAYCEIDGQIVDPAANAGMRDRSGNPPPRSWYEQGETAMFDLVDPVPSLWIPARA